MKGFLCCGGGPAALCAIHLNTYAPAATQANGGSVRWPACRGQIVQHALVLQLWIVPECCAALSVTRCSGSRLHASHCGELLAQH